MLDKSGDIIRVGDIVRVANSPVKNQNGVFIVAQDGTSKLNSGTDLTMYKMAKHKSGYTLSRNKYNIEFWPLVQMSNIRRHSKEAMAAATIEIIQKASPESFTLTSVENELLPSGYGFDKPEEDYFRVCVNGSNGETIEDFSYLASQAELITAVLSNVALKDGETIRIVKQNHNWGNYKPGGFEYRLAVRKR